MTNHSHYAPPSASIEERIEPHSRRPWLAGLLALLIPGLGHLYLGRRGLAIGILIGAVLVWPIATVGFAITPGGGVLFYAVALGCAAVFWVLQALYAFVLAMRMRVYQLTRDNHVPTYVLFAVSYVVAAAVAGFFVELYVVEIQMVEDSEMAPTLMAGDSVFVRKLGLRAPTYSDLVAYEHHYDAATGGHLVKYGRVIGLPGDQLEAYNGEWRRNGEVMPTRFVRELTYRSVVEEGKGHETTGAMFERTDGDSSYFVLRHVEWERRAPFDAFDPVTVRDGHVFVVGDQLEQAYDSRTYGPIKVRHIIGEAIPLK